HQGPGRRLDRWRHAPVERTGPRRHRKGHRLQRGGQRPAQAMSLLDDLALRARDRLPERIHAAISRGVGGSSAFEANLQAWRELKLAPHVLSGARVADPATSVLGTRVSTPVLLAPAGLPRGVSHEAECDAARGAAEAGTLMVLSHHS